MRTDEGEEIIEPGDYDLGDERRLRVYLTQDDDEQVEMWACTHCQPVDGVLNSILTLVLDGAMNATQDADGEFQLSMTPAGLDRAKSLIEQLTDDDPDDPAQESETR